MKPYPHKLCINTKEYGLLRDYIQELSGIALGELKAYLLENRLAGLVFESGCKSFGDFYLKLKHGSEAASLREKMIDLISTNETFWFRDKHPFDKLETVVFPDLYGKLKEGRSRYIDIWCAACSTGQEPYSIAMKAIEFYKKNATKAACEKQVRIIATDISNTAISKAKEGLYDTTAMKRGLDQQYKDAHFKEKNKMWAVSDDVKKMVTFQEFNLKDTPRGNFGPFDVIFLRHVIIYFSDEFKKTIFDKMARLLKPDGFLFLGNGENVAGYSTGFKKVADSDYPFYQIVMK
jgi:chemotaxis protein methyltransferase CheR